MAYIKNDPKGALEAYKTITGDKTSIDDLMAIMNEPGFIDDYRTEPQGTMKFATHLNKVGTLKVQPKAWTDYYLPKIRRPQRQLSSIHPAEGRQLSAG